MIKSPLRYPGGKAKMFSFFQKLIIDCDLIGSTYCEPYAGGAGLALQLLASGLVNQIRINDIDPGVYSFWTSIKKENEAFCDLIDSTPLTIDEWKNQKSILEESTSTQLSRGFAFFFLNRTNRSGIIEGAGPIGGYSQSGKWKIDARFNRDALKQNLKFISRFSDQIDITQMDAVEFCKSNVNSDSIFYLDPPYYVKGSKLYRNHYKSDDHKNIRDFLNTIKNEHWVLTYDDTEAIRSLYVDYSPVEYELLYSAGKNGFGKEVMFLSDGITNLLQQSPSDWLTGSRHWGVQKIAS